MIETTWYRFYSEVRVFISDLFRKPLDADTSEYLKKRGFSKKKLLQELMSRGIIERSEKILDKSNSDKEKPTYSVKYKRYANNFEKKIHDIYKKYFEKKKEEEIDEASSCGSVGGSYEIPLFSKPISRPIYESKKIIISPDQFRLVELINSPTVGDLGEATATANVGNYQYDTPGLVLKTSDRKRDPSYNR